MMESVADGQRLPYVIRRIADNCVIGTSSYMGMRPSQRGVEIGATFLHPSARGSYANPECKLLMLERAFKSGAVRVEFVVDAENRRSQAAVLKLGAVREGLLRSRKVAWNGEVRDVVYYSITEDDWTRVRESLVARLSAYDAFA